MLSRDRGERDLASSQCVFAQAYRQLSDTDPKLLRTVWDGERVFQVREEEPLTAPTEVILKQYILELLPFSILCLGRSCTVIPYNVPI